MELSLSQVLLYALLPVFCMIIGGLISGSRLPEHTLGMGVQNCAAGVVFAAVALELLPKVISAKEPWEMVFGFMVGLVLMYLIKEITERLQRSKEMLHPALPRGQITGVGIDLFVDGLLISVAFAAGAKGGILIALALSVEELFLGMTFGGRGEKATRRMVHIIILASVILLGVLFGFSIMQLLPPNTETFVLSFGMAALLFLVTEELLTEVHAKLESPWMTAMFLVGFLFILIVETTW